MRFKLRPLDILGKEWEVSDGDYPMERGTYLDMYLLSITLNKKYHLT